MDKKSEDKKVEQEMNTNFKEKLKSEVVSGTTKGKFEFPEGVKSKGAYLKWKLLEGHEVLANKEFPASDGTNIKIGWLTKYFKTQIAHLPQDEQAKLIERKTLWQQTRTKANGLKQAAYGNAHGARKLRITEYSEFPEIASKAPYVLELFGKMFNASDVHEVCVMEWNLDVSKDTLRRFRLKHIDLITKKIEQFKESHNDVRLGIKRSRLDELCWMYSEAKKQFVNDKQNKWLRDMRDILKQIKDEVEEDTLIIKGNLDINVEQTINLHLQREATKGITLRQIIVGRTAAKIGVNPVVLISELTKSYYAPFTKLGDDDVEDIPYTEIEYPSESHYDFNQIIRNEDELLVAKKVMDQNLEEKAVESAEMAIKSGLKEKLLAKILKDKTDLENKSKKLKILIDAKFDEKKGD